MREEEPPLRLLLEVWSCADRIVVAESQGAPGSRCPYVGPDAELRISHVSKS